MSVFHFSCNKSTFLIQSALLAATTRARQGMTCVPALLSWSRLCQFHESVSGLIKLVEVRCAACLVLVWILRERQPLATASLCRLYYSPSSCMRQCWIRFASDWRDTGTWGINYHKCRPSTGKTLQWNSRARRIVSEGKVLEAYSTFAFLASTNNNVNGCFRTL